MFANKASRTPNLPQDHMGEKPHHVVDILEYVGKAADDQGELVLGDVDEAFLIVLRAHFGVCVLLPDFHR